MVEVILYGKAYLAKPLTRPRARSKSFTGENYSGVLSPKYSSPTYSFFRTTYVATKRNNQKKGSQAVYPLELKKAVEAIFIRPMQGSKITLVMRKAYNVLLQRAQEQGQEVVTYRVPLSEIIRDIHYDSHDYELLKQYLRRLNATQVEWDLLTEEGKKRWGVSTMLSEAEIVDRHLEFSFAPKIKKRLLDPAIYHRIDLRLQTRFRSNYALALFEACGRYINNPSGVTAKLSWTTWRSILCGEDSEHYNEFKYFNRDVLKRAIKEVNAVSDIEIELRITKESGKVTDLQFGVQRKKQKGLDLDDPNLIDSRLFQDMIKLGLSKTEAMELWSEHEEAEIAATLELVQKRAKRAGLAKVENPGAYFRNALKKGYAPSILIAPPAAAKETVPTPSSAKDVMERIRAEYGKSRNASAREQLKLWPQQKRDEMFDDFKKDKDATQYLDREMMKKGIASKVVETTFIAWLSAQLWPAPTEAALLNYGLQAGIIRST